MNAYEYITKHLGCVWRHHGGGTLQRICFYEPYEIIAVCMTHAWLGDPDRFVKEFTVIESAPSA